MLNHEYIKNIMLQEAIFSPSHGTTESFLGMGMLYYTLAYFQQAKLCVCLGSGDGFVPRLMRQAQRDVPVRDSITYLVDADMPEAGWGGPDYFNKPDGVFRKEFDVHIVKLMTKDAIQLFRGRRIDYLHIDADHSYEHVKEDFDLYAPLSSIITLHDTDPLRSDGGVYQFLDELVARDDCQIINFKGVGHGTAIILRSPK